MCNDTYNLYPPLEPYYSDWLNVGNGHAIYFEQSGNPEGIPVVFLHGGPGSGCNPGQRRFFDPEAYRIILLDQRGCGRSTPQGETQHNSTDDLVNDIERLRVHLVIDKWLVFGGSWGSTLALAYAIAHPSKPLGLILRGIFLSRQHEIDWFLGESRQFVPEAWQALLDYLPTPEQSEVLDAYSRRIFSADPAVHFPAARRWNDYEGSIMTLLPAESAGTPASDEVQLARARVQIHYIKQLCFVGHRNLLQEASALTHIPTRIVQGRYDLVCPPLTAWELRQAMPHATLEMIADAGHSAMEHGTRHALIAATEHFKHLLSNA